MYARIEQVRQMSSLLHYNERKVLLEKAELIDCCNFPLTFRDLNPSLYKSYIKSRDALNLSSQVKSLHVMLSFSSNEEIGSFERQRALSREYMHLIGFGKQPYLTYRHFDTAIPHLHIVSTTIKANGQRIDTSNLLILHSIPAVDLLIKKYQLGQSSSRNDLTKLDRNRPKKLQYGSSSTKQGMEHVVRFAKQQYCFTTFEEWNAILSSYGLRALRLENKGKNLPGLLYFLIDTQKKNIGTGILASRLKTKPTFKNLELLYKMNSFRVVKKSSSIRAQLKLILLNSNFSGTKMKQELWRNGISIHPGTDSSSDNNIIFLDHVNNCAISAFSLGLEKTHYNDIALAMRQLISVESRKDSYALRDIKKQNSYRKQF